MLNKKLGKIISVTLAVLIIVASLPTFSVFASDIIDSGTCGDNLTWTLDSEGLLTIFGMGEMYDYDYYHLYSPWHSYSDSIKTVEIKNGATSIGSYAFYNCTGLASITIPDRVTSIEGGAFSGCSGLTTVTIGNDVTSIGGSAFNGCTGLTSIIIPDSVTSIEVSAFNGCTGLTSILVSEHNENYSSENGILFNKDKTKLLCCPKGKGGNCIILSGVTNIGERAFSYCTGLTSVTIPNSVTSIGDEAFYNCTGLASIIIPDRVTSIEGGAFSGCTGLTSITIPDSVTSIGSSAFYNTAWLNNQPDGLVYAGKVAYEYKGNCPSSITIKEGTVGIADSAFGFCRGLTSVTIPDSVTSIGDGAFSCCTGITSIIIPNSVTSIGERAFSYCTGMTSIIVEEENQYYSSEDGILFNKSQTEIVCYSAGKTGDYVIPSKTASISSGAFYGCTGLTSVTIPDSVTSIGRWAFYGCSVLASITIPDSVTSIGEYAFYNTAWLNNQPDGLVYAGKVAYEYKGACPSNITFKEETVGIAESAFLSRVGLTNITIPDSVTSIGNFAFDDCFGLTTVYYGGSQEQRNQIEIGSYNGDLINANWVYNYAEGTVSYDITGDGYIDSSDLALIVNSLIYSEVYNKAYDLNKDGNVNILDLIKMKKQLANMI